MAWRIAGIIWLVLVVCAVLDTCRWLVFHPGQNEFLWAYLFILGLPWSVLVVAWLQYLPDWLAVAVLSLGGFGNAALLFRAGRKSK